MKAAQIIGYGGSEVVKINDIPAPIVSGGKILVEVHAAGVNPFDWKVRQGYMQQMMPLTLPATLGGDFSGVIKETGEGVSEYKKGDEVYGQANIFAGGSGAFAQLAATSPNQIALKPINLSHIQAASLPLAGVSAWIALAETIKLTQDPAFADSASVATPAKGAASAGKQKILIHGGAGGIGTIAIQLAKHLGAYVATTVSSQDVEYAKSLGADEVVDYKTEKFAEKLRDFDAVFDTVGGETYKKSFEVLKKGGILVSMVEAPLEELAKMYDVKNMMQMTRITGERLGELNKLVGIGVIKVNIDKTFTLEQTALALSYMQNGENNHHPNGKVVITNYT